MTIDQGAGVARAVDNHRRRREIYNMLQHSKCTHLFQIFCSQAGLMSPTVGFTFVTDRFMNVGCDAD